MVVDESSEQPQQEAEGSTSTTTSGTFLNGRRVVATNWNGDASASMVPVDEDEWPLLDAAKKQILAVFDVMLEVTEQAAMLARCFKLRRRLTEEELEPYLPLEGFGVILLDRHVRALLLLSELEAVGGMREGRAGSAGRKLLQRMRSFQKRFAEDVPKVIERFRSRDQYPMVLVLEFV